MSHDQNIPAADAVLPFDPANTEALGAFIDARIKHGVETALSEYREKRRCDFSHLENDQLRSLILSFEPDARHRAGKLFLVAILETGGRDGLQAFMHRMEDALEEKRNIDPETDFTEHERQLLVKCNPKILTRRQMVRILLTYGGIAAGGAALAGSTLEGVDDGIDYLSAKKKDEFETEHFGSLKKDLITLHPIVDASAGAVALAASLSELNKIRLEQVAEAITELAIHAGPNPGARESKLTKKPVITHRGFRSVIDDMLSHGRNIRGDGPKEDISR